ncbi:CCA tRNA nucleotidyltransferase [uncultured Maritimibacter sp.]|jgi:poly(A) polymerase|uniref:CCA tRNA nucleotidyltransferase n=1 Tax=uncultured Maritimibacter sp. TaxID=991866 RepID=UPI000A7EDEE2|nr:CCA tRNA nucleotidyltransferase [uncultured Maritimibacter sp.]
MTQVSGDWMEGAAQGVCAMLTDAGFAAHFVGGCVRNALLGAPVADVDIATNATPEIVSNLAKDAGLTPVPTGIEHGTVTVVADGIPFEVTTWRRDVETDGRRAVVAFADRLEDDARRRDFTMNALYATATGEVVDPLGGMDDLRARRVRFIDDAADRIREDYLRILRFFRFHAWYGDPREGMDPDALAAIAELAEGLDGLSRERVGAEMLKLLAAPDPAPALATMAQVGVLGRILPGADPRAVPLLVHFEERAGLSPDPIRRLATLGGEDHKEALRLSNTDDKRLAVLLSLRGDPMRPKALGYRVGAEAGQSVLLINSALLETDFPPDAMADAVGGAAQVFPVSAADLMPALQGPALGERLRALEDRWIASDFTLTKEELLA